jgi:hypothetical protein
MDAIKFAIEQYTDEEFGYSFPVINIYINDHNMIDLVSEIENKHRAVDKGRNTRSNYIGFEATHFKRFRDEMLGRKVYLHSVLLTCTCTFAECNCIMAEIAIETQTVTWSDLKSPWLGGKTPSPWIDESEAQEMGWQPFDYTGLGPFVFERGQYLSALDNITQEWHLRNP